MAVQKSRKTSSKRGMHRSHDHLSGPALSKDPTTGNTHVLWVDVADPASDPS